MTYHAVSVMPRQQGSLITSPGPVTSDPFNPDTDGDGLSDFLEFDLSAGQSVPPRSSNPRAADTDGDGLTDKQELVGITVRDLGIVFLDPIDADVDNDMRSDGDEAELVDVEGKRWVVAPVGKAPYRVYSDPRFADADFDGVVDGQEFGGTYRTDPNNGNTDGDPFDDGQEFAAGTNPLKPELDVILVTVFFNSLTITADGDWDPGDEAGDFAFDFGVRLPGTGPIGLNQHFTSRAGGSLRPER